MKFSKKIGNLGLGFGWFNGENFSVINLQIFEVIPDIAVTSFSLTVVKLVFTVYWDL